MGYLAYKNLYSSFILSFTLSVYPNHLNLIYPILSYSTFYSSIFLCSSFFILLFFYLPVFPLYIFLLRFFPFLLLSLQFYFICALCFCTPSLLSIQYSRLILLILYRSSFSLLFSSVLVTSSFLFLCSPSCISFSASLSF